tara:strand:+ start:122 stop:700 length:579 start_codon:yes stop_codon:yes gene_type:complete
MAGNAVRLAMKRYLLLLMAAVAVSAEGHGVTSTSAKIEVRPSRLVEISVQFDFIELLNQGSKKYPLAIVTALPEDKFGLLYNEVVKLFDRELKVLLDNEKTVLNKRYPSQQQMFNLLKSQLFDSRFSTRSLIPYTYSDRRYFQVVSFDFKLVTTQQLDKLAVIFPPQLGDVYVTFSKSSSRSAHPGELWQPN